MAPTAKSSDFDARFLDRLVGTKVSTFDDIDHQEPSAVSPATSGIYTSVASVPADSLPEISPPGISLPGISPRPASFTTTSHEAGRPTTASTAATAPGLSAPGSPLPRVRSTWVITKKLSERVAYLTWEQVEKDMGTPRTVGVFLCHLEEGPAQLAFM